MVTQAAKTFSVALALMAATVTAVATAERPPTDAAVCLRYEQLLRFYRGGLPRLNDIERFCHNGD